MNRAAIAQAIGVEEGWLDGWSDEPIGIYPAELAEEAGSGTFERVSRSADTPGMWIVDIGVRNMIVSALEASRVRYALDRLRVPHFGRAVQRKEKDDAGSGER